MFCQPDHAHASRLLVVPWSHATCPCPGPPPTAPTAPRTSSPSYTPTVGRAGVKWIHAKPFGGPYPSRPLATSGESLARAERLLEEKQARKEVPTAPCTDINEACRGWADIGEVRGVGLGSCGWQGCLGRAARCADGMATGSGLGFILWQAGTPPLSGRSILRGCAAGDAGSAACSSAWLAACGSLAPPGQHQVHPGPPLPDCAVHQEPKVYEGAVQALLWSVLPRGRRAL